MLAITLCLVLLLVALWALCRILQLMLRTILNLVSAIMCSLLPAAAGFGLPMILALRASQC